MKFSDSEPDTDPQGRKRRNKKLARDMLQNIKLPHWVIGILTGIAIILPVAIHVEQGGYWQLPSWLLPVEGGILSVIATTGVVSSSVLPTVNARAAMRRAAIKVTSAILMAIAFLSCTKEQLQDVKVDTIDAAECVLKQVAALGLPVPTSAYAGIAISCGIGAAECQLNPTTCQGAVEVANLLAQHEALRAKENSMSQDDRDK